MIGIYVTPNGTIEFEYHSNEMLDLIHNLIHVSKLKILKEEKLKNTSYSTIISLEENATMSYKEFKDLLKED